MKYQLTEKILTSGREAWNEITVRVDREPSIHKENETFRKFYKVLVQKLSEQAEKE